jgi:large subunit ribosomal protein L29
MTGAESRDLSTVELESRQSEAREQLFRLRFQISMGQTDGVKKYRATKKDLARILTALGQKTESAEGK